MAEVVGIATKQALRARNYIQDSPRPEFLREDGSRIKIDKSKVEYVIPLVVSLSSLDVFKSELSELRTILGVSDPIWAVSLTDLRQISEVISRPSEFSHYLHWRLAVGNEENIFGDRDELNWLGIYLKTGPNTPVPPAGFDVLTFTSHTEDFDTYFMHKLGARTKEAPRPSQHLPDPLPAVLDAIEQSGILGFTEIAEALLDCSFAERDKLAQMLNEFALLHQRGRAQILTVDCEKQVFYVDAMDRSCSELRTIAPQMGYSQPKTRIFLSVRPQEQWTVSGWFIQRTRPNETT